MEVNSSLADDPHLEVTINCEFLEDIGYPRPWLEDELAELQSDLHEGLQNLGDELQNIGSKISKSLTDLTAPETTDEGKPILREVREEGREREVPQQQSKYWATTWGPPRYKKSNHPLNIMVRLTQQPHRLVNGFAVYDDRAVPFNKRTPPMDGKISRPLRTAWEQSNPPWTLFNIAIYCPRTVEFTSPLDTTK